MAKEQLAQQGGANATQDRVAQLLAGTTTRRGLFKGVLGLAAGAGTASALGLRSNVAQAQDTTLGGPKTLTPVAENATPEADTEETTEAQEGLVEYYGVNITGAPESVDPANVEVAKEDNGFKNTIGHGSEQAFAIPGGLWVGDDFPDEEIKKSRGTIQRFNKLTQGKFTTNGPEDALSPEGGWTFFSLGKGKFAVDDIQFHMKGKKGRNHFFAVRGLYKDDQQDADRNGLIEVSHYVPAANEWSVMGAGMDGNIAFLDEGQLLQRAKTSHTDSTNCGAEGCSELVLTVFDRNTQAFSILKQTQGRNEDASQGWEFIGSNWNQPK